MASPMIAGIVANLLVVQPTLSFDGILQALKQNEIASEFAKCKHNQYGFKSHHQPPSPLSAND